MSFLNCLRALKREGRGETLLGKEMLKRVIVLDTAAHGLEAGETSLHSQELPSVVVPLEGPSDNRCLVVEHWDGRQHKGRASITNGPSEFEVILHVLSREDNLDTPPLRHREGKWFSLVHPKVMNHTVLKLKNKVSMFSQLEHERGVRRKRGGGKRNQGEGGAKTSSTDLKK